MHFIVGKQLITNRSLIKLRSLIVILFYKVLQTNVGVETVQIVSKISYIYILNTKSTVYITLKVRFIEQNRQTRTEQKFITDLYFIYKTKILSRGKISSEYLFKIYEIAEL